MTTNRETQNRGTTVNHEMIFNTLTSVPVRRCYCSGQQTTTATFTVQKRYFNDVREAHRSKPELLVNQEEEQLVRTRLSTRTSSFPATRCITYYYDQNQMSSQTKIIHDQHHSRLNSVANERIRSHSYSSSQNNGNGSLVTPDISDPCPSFDNIIDDDHCHWSGRSQSSHKSIQCSSKHFSQHAVAKFMHERNNARLRRNQKASQMLGKIIVLEYSFFFSYKLFE